MSGTSDIEWCDATWNPVRGCIKVSPGCKHCYAETFAERWRGIPGHAYEQGFDPRLVPESLDVPLRWKKPRTIFVNSMSDLFGDFVPDEYIEACFGVMGVAQQHTYQVLTKRAERLPGWFASLGAHPHERCVAELFARHDIEIESPQGRRGWLEHAGAGWLWPLQNVQLGVSVENQKYADERIPHLLATPAAVRFLSIEPLLGPVDLTDLVRREGHGEHHFNALECDVDPGDDEWNGATIDWVIVGGESGPGAREMDPAWVRSLRDQCVAAGVPFFFKQWGGIRKKLRGRLLDGRAWDEMPARASA